MEAIIVYKRLSALNVKLTVMNLMLKDLNYTGDKCNDILDFLIKLVRVKIAYKNYLISLN